MTICVRTEEIEDFYSGSFEEYYGKRPNPCHYTKVRLGDLVPFGYLTS